MENIRNLVKKYWAIGLIFIVPIPSLFWLRNGSSLMHGLFYPWPESFSSLFGIAKYYLFSWISNGMGAPNTEPSGFLYHFARALFLAVGGNPHIGQALFFYLGFAGILGSMYFLARTLKFDRTTSVIASVFYLVSPFVFTGMPIEIVNFRQMPYHIATPLILAVFVRALDSVSFRKQLFLFGLVSLVATAGYGSLQYLVLHLLILFAYSLFVLFLSIKDKTKFRKALFRLIALFGVLFLVNSYWLSPLLFNLQDAYNSRSEPGFAIIHDSDMVAGTSAQMVDILRMMPYKAQGFISPWIQYYYRLLPSVILFIFLAVIPLIFFNRDKSKKALFPSILLIISVFLTKGVNEPFAFIGKAIFFIHPYFTRLFRNVTYFELVVVLALSLLVGLSVGNILSKVKKKILLWPSTIVLIVMLTILGWPFVTGIGVRQANTNGSSQSNKTPEYFKELVAYLKDKKELSRIDSVPTFTFQDVFVVYQWESIYNGSPLLDVWPDKSLYRPLYPKLIGKVDHTLQNVLHPQGNLMSEKEWDILSSMGNVRYVAFHRDTAWDILYKIDPKKFSSINDADIKNFLSNNTSLEKIESFGKIDLYRVIDENFLPKFYTPKSVFIFDENNQDFLSKTLANINYQVRSAMYTVDSQDKGLLNRLLVDKQKVAVEKENKISDSSVVGKEEKVSKCEYCKVIEDLPVLEFKKINPTKYRVAVHGAKGTFPLVFSEGFHEGWRLYLSKSQIPNPKSQTNIKNQISNYRVLEGSVNEQADKEELGKYTENGWVTDLGNSGAGFVSKNFQDTIQNDNLSPGRFYETWFQRNIGGDSHTAVNMYANSWLIDAENICKQNNGGCIRNADGSYDIELVVECWPQRVFYIGMAISGVALLGCMVIYLMTEYITDKRKKRKKI